MPHPFAAIIAITLLLSLCACRSTPEETARNERVVRVQTNTAPVLQPAAAVSGRVLVVKEPLGFVVVDFPNGRMPQLDQRLSVYRLDQKVAEIKISGPFRGTTVAADITAGHTLEGDLVRDR